MQLRCAEALLLVINQLVVKTPWTTPRWRYRSDIACADRDPAFYLIISSWGNISFRMGIEIGPTLNFDEKQTSYGVF